MDKLKNFWSTKSEGEKRKIIVYLIAGVVCVGLLFTVIALNSEPSDTKVADFSNPDAKEVEKFNNRSDANNLGKTDSASLNVAMDDLFGDSNSNAFQPSPDAGSGYVEPNYSTVSPGSGSGSNSSSGYVQPNYSSSPATSSHSTYGDYSMWQSEEPKNNSVGYSNKGVPAQKSNQGSSQPVYTEIPSNNGTYQEPAYQTQSATKNIGSGKQIRAKLLSQGYATSGRSLSFVMLEPTKINGETITKGQSITGTSYEENGRLMVNFSSIKIKNKVVNVQMQLLGSDGMPGLPIAGTNNINPNGSAIENKGRDLARDQINRIPVIGGVIGGVIGSGTKTADNRIKLSTNVECIIVNYN